MTLCNPANGRPMRTICSFYPIFTTQSSVILKKVVNGFFFGLFLSTSESLHPSVCTSVHSHANHFAASHVLGLLPAYSLLQSIFAIKRVNLETIGMKLSFHRKKRPKWKIFDASSKLFISTDL